MNITIISTILLITLIFFSPVEAKCRSRCRQRRRYARAIREARAQAEKERALALQAKHVEEAMNAESISILHSDYYYKTKALFYKPLCKVIDDSFSLQTDKPVLDHNSKFSQILSQNAKDIIAKNVTDWYAVEIYTKKNFPNTYRGNNVTITKNFDDVVQYYNEHCYVPSSLPFITVVLGGLILSIVLFAFKH